MKNTLSIDFEDWFQPFAARSISGWDRFPSRVPQDTQRLLSLLSRHNVRCTFFILGEVAEKFPECIKAIHEAGHEIGSHGHRHVPLFKQDPEKFEQEMRVSLDLLQQLTGEPVLGFRAPFFSVREESLWAIDSLKRLGLQYDTSVNPIARAFHGYTRGGDQPFTHENGLREFPITTYRLAGLRIPFGGGMYYRLLPYPLIRQGLKRLNARGTAANVYFHPREFDPDLPRLKTGLKTGLAMKLIVYAGTRSLECKLARLLEEFTFVPMRELL